MYNSYKEYIENFSYDISEIIEKGGGALEDYNLEILDYINKEEKIFKQVTICDEPIKFVKQLTTLNTIKERNEKMEELIQNFQVLNEAKSPENYQWINGTSKGINIRIGSKDDDTIESKIIPKTLGDNSVHGVVVGRTGSGKSILINNIIFNLITEYSPWELDLYLVDMKKVELSRYMNTEDDKYLTPHVVSCAATSEVRYVVSMIEYITKCMLARQELFASLGYQKIQTFREQTGLVLPRILLLVDEFQQLFSEASPKERKILDQCILSITKLGRSSGVHLLFASQEMSGALDGKSLANFKLRIALSCDENVSTQILGNSEASTIKELGITLVNDKGGKTDFNEKYITPNIKDMPENDEEISEFNSYLKSIFDLSKNYNFNKVQKFYQEDVQEKIDKIKLIKNNLEVQKQIKELCQNNKSYIDAFILGTSVIYSNNKNDYESIFISLFKKNKFIYKII